MWFRRPLFRARIGIRRNRYDNKRRESGDSMRRDQQAAGEYTAGVCICGQVQCGKIIPHQCADEPQSLCKNLLAAGQNPDHQFLQHQRGIVLRGPAGLRLCQDSGCGEGKMGQDDRAVSQEFTDAQNGFPAH